MVTKKSVICWPREVCHLLVVDRDPLSDPWCRRPRRFRALGLRKQGDLKPLVARAVLESRREEASGAMRAPAAVCPALPSVLEWFSSNQHVTLRSGEGLVLYGGRAVFGRASLAYRST